MLAGFVLMAASAPKNGKPRIVYHSQHMQEHAALNPFFSDTAIYPDTTIWSNGDTTVYAGGDPVVSTSGGFTNAGGVIDTLVFGDGDTVVDSNAPIFFGAGTPFPKKP